MITEAKHYKWLKRLFTVPHIDRYILLAAVCLLAFSLNTGISADDYVHQLILSQSEEIKGFRRYPLDLFRFTEGQSLRLLMEDGVVSWWADPQSRLAFFRPISALTHYIDHLVWPNSSVMMRLHSLFWSLIVFLGIRSLYRSMLSPSWIASMAIFIYVLDDTRSWFVSWIAARNAVVATAFSIWVLVFHHRYMANGWKPGAVSAPFFFVLGLLSGEGTVAIFAYLFSYAVYIDEGRIAIRLKRLLPYGVIILIWRLGLTLSGYGVMGSGLYVDPLESPWRFFLTFCEHAPILLLAQWGGFWADLWNSFFVLPGLARLFLLGAVFFVVSLCVLFLPLWRKDRWLRFFLSGALFSTVFASATFTSDRLLTWIAIGASAALAILISNYMRYSLEPWIGNILSRTVPATVLTLIIINIITAPFVLPSRARGNIALKEMLDRADSGVSKDPSIKDKLLIFMNPPGVPMASYIPIMRAVKGVPRAKSQHWLATSTSQLMVERVDETSLRLRPQNGFFINPSDMLLRSPDRPFRIGQVVDLEDFEVHITEMTADNRPAEILVRFHQRLESPDIVWRCWEGTGYRPCKPPLMGEHTRYAAADYFQVVLGKPFLFRLRYTTSDAILPFGLGSNGVE